MKAKKLVSLGLALALALAAAPVMAAGQQAMDEWNQQMDASGAKGGMVVDGPAALKGSLAPGHGGSVAAQFDNDKDWVNKNPQTTAGGDSDANFNKDSDWK